MFDLNEAAAYYRRQGAPSDQNALRNFLREIQDAHGGHIPREILPEAAGFLGVKESFLLALIRRTPSLHLSDRHVLELCSKCAARFLPVVEGRTDITVKLVPCLRQCAKGPNLRWDGTLYNHADEALLRKLLDSQI